MPTPGQELSSLDFENLIGGPLVAVVNAQAQSANSTINFIKTVGFKESNNEFDAGENSTTSEPIYVSFIYPKETVPYSPAVPADPAANPPVAAVPEQQAQYRDHQLRVPILTILPIPYLRVEEVTVDFNAKINSLEYTKTDSKVRFGVRTQARAGFLFASAKLKTSFSYQKNTTSGNRVERTYSMAIHVRAVQDEMPAGMERILGILEDAIISTPTGPANAPHPVDRP